MWLSHLVSFEGCSLWFLILAGQLLLDEWEDDNTISVRYEGKQSLAIKNLVRDVHLMQFLGSVGNVCLPVCLRQSTSTRIQAPI